MLGGPSIGPHRAICGFLAFVDFSYRSAEDSGSKNGFFGNNSVQ